MKNAKILLAIIAILVLIFIGTIAAAPYVTEEWKAFCGFVLLSDFLVLLLAVAQFGEMVLVSVLRRISLKK